MKLCKLKKLSAILLSVIFIITSLTANGVYADDTEEELDGTTDGSEIEEFDSDFTEASFGFDESADISIESSDSEEDELDGASSFDYVFGEEDDEDGDYDEITFGDMLPSESFEAEEEIDGASELDGASSYETDGSLITDEDGNELEDEYSESKDGDGTSETDEYESDGSEDDDLDGGSAPTGYTMSVSKTKVAVNSKFNLKITMKNADYGYLYIRKNDNVISKTKVYSGKNYNVSFSALGTYRIYMIIYNKYGSYNGYNHSGKSLYVTAGYPPSKYTISCNKTSCATGSSVTFKVTNYSATKIKAVALKNGKEYSSAYVSSCFNVKFPSAGTWTIYLILYNDYGSFNGYNYGGSLKITVTDKKPTAYTITPSSKSITIGTSVTYTCSVNTATSATVVVLKDGKAYDSKTFSGFSNSKFSFTIKPYEAGTYTLYLKTKNDSGTYNGSSKGPKATLTVKGAAPSAYYMTINKTTASTGESINFSINFKNADYYYFVVLKDGVQYYKKNHGTSTGITFKAGEAATYTFYLITYNSYGSYNGYSKGKTLTCTVNSTSTYQMLRDNYSFSNSHSNFGYGSSYHIPLSQYTSVFGKTLGYTKYLADGKWGGSCFGMASTSSLFYKKTLNYKSYSSSAASLYSISAPKSSTNSLTKLIERYQIGQSLSAVRNEKSSNKNNYSGLISAVRNFHSNNSNPVIIGVFNDSFGHALVGLSVSTDTSGNYLINVYDCNYPSDKSKYITINKNMTAFSYSAGYSYSAYLNYCYASTEYSAMPSSARSSSLDGSSEEEDDYSFTISIDADSFDIVNSEGYGIDEIDGAYEIEILDQGDDTNYIQYALPEDVYTVTFENSEAKATNMLVSNSTYNISSSAYTQSGSFELGTVGSSERLLCTTNTDDISNISITTFNDDGERQYFELDGTKLAVSNVSTNTFEVSSSEGYVYQNGAKVTVGSIVSGGGEDEELDGSSSGYTLSNNLDSFEVDELDGGSGLYDFGTYERCCDISSDEGFLDGSIGVVVNGDTGDLCEVTARAAVYDEEGRMIGYSDQTVILGLGKNYVDFDFDDGEVVTSGDLTAKIMFWDENMTPLAQELEITL